MPLPTKEAATALLHQHVRDDYQRHHALMVATAMEGYASHFSEDPLLWYLTGLLHDIDFQEHPDTHPGPSLQWFRDWGYPDTLIHAVEAHALPRFRDEWRARTEDKPCDAGKRQQGKIDRTTIELDYHGLRPPLPEGHPSQSPSTSFRATPDGVTISALPRSVTTPPQSNLAAALVACDELTGIFYAYRKMNPVRYGEMKPASIRKKFKDPGFAAKIDRATIQLGCDKLGIPLDDHIANLVRFFAPLA